MTRLTAPLLLVSAVTLLAGRTPAQEPKKEAAAEFKEYVGVYTKNYPQQQMVLQNVKVRQVGDRSFLVGTPIIVSDDSTSLTPKKGVLWWVSLAEVSEFYEFDDIKGYRYDGRPAR